MKKLFFALVLAAAILSACNKEAADNSYGRKAVEFKVANISYYIMKSTATIGEAGSSQAGIYAADLGANNIAANVSGTSLTPTKQIFWKVGQKEATRFIARYPYAEGSTIDGEYTIASDQTNADTYSYQENMMTAVASATPDPGTVEFNFTHPFAKVLFNITNNLGADAVASVVFKNVRQAASKLDLTTSPATPTLTSDKTDVTAYKSAENTYALILMPQDATAENDIVVTTQQGSVYTFRISNASYAFSAGKVAKAALTLDPIDGSSGSAPIAVGTMSFTSSEWSDGEATTIGQIGEATLGSYFQIGGTVYTDSASDEAWSKWYNMTLTAENIWTIVIHYDESKATDESAKGFLLRVPDGEGFKYFKMFNESENIGSEEYGLFPEDATHTRNILLPQASGQYLITFNSSTNNITATLQ